MPALSRPPVDPGFFPRCRHFHVGVVMLGTGSTSDAAIRKMGGRAYPVRPSAAVPIFIDRAVRNLPITIYGTGEQTRDFIFVKDIAAANAYFATQSQATGVFNVAYGGSITIKNLCATICQLTGSKSEIKHAPERAGDVKHSLAAINRLRAAGFVPVSDFSTGLRTTINAFKAARA